MAKQAAVDQIQYLVLSQVSAVALEVTTVLVVSADLEAVVAGSLVLQVEVGLPIKVLPEGQMYLALLVLSIHVVAVVVRAALVVLLLEPLLGPVELA
jgi:hypothetical protein